MHCAAQPAPRTTKAKTHFGSRLSRPAAPQVVAVVAVAAGALSKSASKLNPAVKAKALGAGRGLSIHDRFRETGTSFGDKVYQHLTAGSDKGFALRQGKLVWSIYTRLVDHDATKDHCGHLASGS